LKIYTNEFIKRGIFIFIPVSVYHIGATDYMALPALWPPTKIPWSPIPRERKRPDNASSQRLSPTRPTVAPRRSSCFSWVFCSQQQRRSRCNLWNTI